MRLLTRLVITPLVVLLAAGIAVSYASFDGDRFERKRVVRVEASAELMSVLFIVKSSAYGELRVVNDENGANLATFRKGYMYPVTIARGETVSFQIRVTPIRQVSGERLTASCWFVDRGRAYNRRTIVTPADSPPLPVECRYTTTG